MGSPDKPDLTSESARRVMKKSRLPFRRIRSATLMEYTKLRTEILLIWIASVALSIGIVFYMTGRPAGTLCCVPAWLYTEHPVVLGGGILYGQLPTFIHVYAFILLSVAIAMPWPALVKPICFFWLLFESVFEVGQHEVVSTVIVGLLNNGTTESLFPGYIANYFKNGRFDYFDLLSIVVGALCAYFTIRFAQKIGVHNATL